MWITEGSIRCPCLLRYAARRSSKPPYKFVHCYHGYLAYVHKAGPDTVGRVQL